MVYRKFLKSIEVIKQRHDQDRVEHPSAMPTEIDIPVRESVRRHCQEDRRRFSEPFAKEVFEHLVDKGLIVPSPYGGHMFPYSGNLPSREEVEDRVNEILARRVNS